MPQPKTDVADLVRRTDEMLRRHAATPSALETVLKKQRSAMAGAGASLHRSGAGRVILPTGISGGKVAAFVAATALLGGGIYALTRKKSEPDPTAPAGRWTEQVQASRASTTIEQGR